MARLPCGLVQGAMTGLFHEKWPWRRDSEGRTFLETAPRWMRWGIGAALVGIALGALMIWSVSHDASRWHLDPLTAERTGKPNDFLVAPEGASAATPDLVLAPIDMPPEVLMARLKEAALAEPRVSVVGGAPEAAHVTYVQRSAVFGFPDYISVRATRLESGTGLAIWSRSRFGYSDLGVNKARVERWLQSLDALEAQQ